MLGGSTLSTGSTRLPSHGEDQAITALPPSYEPGSLGYALRSCVVSIREEFDSFDWESLERPPRQRANRLRRCSATASWRGKPVHYFSPTAFRLGDDKRNIAEQAAGRRISDGESGVCGVAQVAFDCVAEKLRRQISGLPGPTEYLLVSCVDVPLGIVLFPRSQGDGRAEKRPMGERNEHWLVKRNLLERSATYEKFCGSLSVLSVPSTAIGIELKSEPVGIYPPLPLQGTPTSWSISGPPGSYIWSAIDTGIINVRSLRGQTAARIRDKGGKTGRALVAVRRCVYRL